jgi:Bifunctional DNA primase/polymerase, N-terminal/AAA domain
VTLSPQHQAAREYAANGYPVFPCRPGAKEPATPRGFYDASTDLRTIDEWWAGNPDFNVALCPGDCGWVVVDIDMKPGKDGLSEWAELAERHGAPPTRRVRTPSGGWHLYFAGTAPSTQSRLGAAIDTRGTGGYVLVPPSVLRHHDGAGYVVLDDRDPAPLPDWVATRTASKAVQAVEAPVPPLDSAFNVMRATRLLTDHIARNSPALYGSGGTFALCCQALDLGVSAPRLLALMTEVWNPHCVPAWGAEELAAKVQNAVAYRQNAVGVHAIAPAAETFGASGAQLARSAERPPRPRFHMEDEAEQEQGDAERWLIPGLLPEQGTVLWVGPTQSFKSFLAQDVAMAVSTGLETFGHRPEPGRVYYTALEGRNAIKTKRRRAWRIARGVEGPMSRFFVGRAPLIVDEDQIAEYVEAIRGSAGGSPVKLIVIDTVAKSMSGMEENYSKDVTVLTNFCDYLVETFRCCVLAVHHTGKGGATRGSSAFEANFDSVVQVTRVEKTKAVKVQVRKHKDAAEPEWPWTFLGQEIAGSLVFRPTTRDEHEAFEGPADTGAKIEFTAKQIADALRAVGAVAGGHAVPTAALADGLCATAPGEGRDAELRRVETALKRSKLSQVYSNGTGQWAIPAIGVAV